METEGGLHVPAQDSPEGEAMTHAWVTTIGKVVVVLGIMWIAGIILALMGVFRRMFRDR